MHILSGLRHLQKTLTIIRTVVLLFLCCSALAGGNAFLHRHSPDKPMRRRRNARTMMPDLAQDSALGFSRRISTG